jgi:hypothetical protein
MRFILPLLLSLCAATASVAGELRPWRPAAPALVDDFDPTSPYPHDYVPPTPVGRGNGAAYFGAGYVEFLFSGGRTPRLPPKTVYVGPLEREPFGNRRTQLRHGMSPRAGTYFAVPAPE